MKYILLSLSCLIVLSSYAQQEIKVKDAKNHIGDSVKICARVYGGKYMASAKQAPTLLDFGGKYPNAPLTLLIWGDTRKQFEKAPEELYKDVQVCLTGRIVLYKGKPEIIIKNRNQIISAVKE